MTQRQWKSVNFSTKFSKAEQFHETMLQTMNRVSFCRIAEDPGPYICSSVPNSCTRCGAEKMRSFITNHHILLFQSTFTRESTLNYNFQSPHSYNLNSWIQFMQLISRVLALQVLPDFSSNSTSPLPKGAARDLGKAWFLPKAAQFSYNAP